MWWNGIDQDRNKPSRVNPAKSTNLANPPVASLNVWKWPTTPMKRIHIDLAGPFQGKVFVDAHSKWPEVIIMSSTTSEKTIEALSSFFARYGRPEQTMGHNLPPWSSTTSCISRYHSLTNGLAERFVKHSRMQVKMMDAHL